MQFRFPDRDTFKVVESDYVEPGWKNHISGFQYMKKDKKWHLLTKSHFDYVENDVPEDVEMGLNPLPTGVPEPTDINTFFEHTPLKEYQFMYRSDWYWKNNLVLFQGFSVPQAVYFFFKPESPGIEVVTTWWNPSPADVIYPDRRNYDILKLFASDPRMERHVDQKPVFYARLQNESGFTMCVSCFTKHKKCRFNPNVSHNAIVLRSALTNLQSWYPGIRHNNLRYASVRRESTGPVHHKGPSLIGGWHMAHIPDVMPFPYFPSKNRQGFEQADFTRESPNFDLAFYISQFGNVALNLRYVFERSQSEVKSLFERRSMSKAITDEHMALMWKYLLEDEEYSTRYLPESTLAKIRILEWRKAVGQQVAATGDRNIATGRGRRERDDDDYGIEPSAVFPFLGGGAESGVWGRLLEDLYSIMESTVEL